MTSRRGEVSLDLTVTDANHQPDPVAAGEMIDRTLAVIARAEGRAKP